VFALIRHNRKYQLALDHPRLTTIKRFIDVSKSGAVQFIAINKSINKSKCANDGILNSAAESPLKKLQLRLMNSKLLQKNFFELW